MEGSNQGRDQIFRECQQNVFSEEMFHQPSMLGEILTPTTTSSSSSFRSLSVGSPEFSYPPIIQNINFKIPTGDHHDEEAMTRAMIAVLSADSSAPSSPGYQNTQNAQIRRPVGAFREYRSDALNPRVLGFKPNACGQKMIKTSLSILKGMHGMRLARQETEEARAPTSNQLHHMISERKRREKLNESFEALRALLPPGSKKDKASVLIKSREYLHVLKARITELEKKNQMLETQLYRNDELDQICSSNEKFEIKLTAETTSTSETQKIELTVIVRVECDMIHLILCLLNCIKKIGNLRLLSTDSITDIAESHNSAKARLTLLVKRGDWDEESFKEAVVMALNDAINIIDHD